VDPQNLHYMTDR